MSDQPKEMPIDEAIKENEDWSLNTDQMIFMMQNNNPIEEAYANDDADYFSNLEASDEYKRLFGEMSFDEAYDRYECTLEG